MDESFLLSHEDSVGKPVEMYVNGTVSNGKTMTISITMTVESFLSAAGRRLGLTHPKRIFGIDGMQIDDIISIGPGDTIFVSEGEDFKLPEGSGATIAGYEIKKLLGKGGFGEVRLGSHIISKERVALKFMAKSTFKSARAAERVVTEIQALTALQHPSIIKMLQVVNKTDFVVLVFEFAAGGDLFNYVKNNKSKHLSEQESRYIFRQILGAVAYAHNHNLCHGDLKLENILLSNRQVTNIAEDKKKEFENIQNSNDPSSYVKHENSYNLEVKVADFGLSVFLQRGKKSKAVGGSTSYMAPEVWNDQNIDGPALDVWCLGCILFSMLTGRLPFDEGNIDEFNIPDDSTMMRKVNSLDYHFNSTQLSRNAKDCVARQLVVSMSDRITIPELFNRPWMAHRRDSEIEPNSMNILSETMKSVSYNLSAGVVEGMGGRRPSIDLEQASSQESNKSPNDEPIKKTSELSPIINADLLSLDINAEISTFEQVSIFQDMSPINATAEKVIFQDLSPINNANDKINNKSVEMPTLELPALVKTDHGKANEISAAQHAQAKINQITADSGIKRLDSTGNNERGRFLKGLRKKNSMGNTTPSNSPQKSGRKNIGGGNGGGNGGGTDGKELFRIENGNMVSPMTPTKPGSIKKKRSGGPPRFGRKHTPKNGT
jgi:serine/threonine protein kinase